MIITSIQPLYLILGALEHAERGDILALEARLHFPSPLPNVLRSVHTLLHLDSECLLCQRFTAWLAKVCDNLGLNMYHALTEVQKSSLY